MIEVDVTEVGWMRWKKPLKNVMLPVALMVLAVLGAIYAIVLKSKPVPELKPVPEAVVLKSPARESVAWSWVSPSQKLPSAQLLSPVSTTYMRIRLYCYNDLTGKWDPCRDGLNGLRSKFGPTLQFLGCADPPHVVDGWPACLLMQAEKETE